MDYMIANKYVSQKCIACGIDLEYLFRQETLYYDESGNDKHLIVKGDKLNTDPNLVFVLGGIQSEDTIKLEDLKARMGKAATTELKSTKDLKGNFVEIIVKDNLKVILQLILEKNWHIHFNAIQILYYGFVDIVDSVPGLSQYSFEFKAILYNVLKKDPSRTVAHFKKYKYPNIKDNQIYDFLGGICDMLDEQMTADAGKGLFNPLLSILKTELSYAKKMKSLVFIQDNNTHVWVEKFEQFYREEIWSFTNKTLVFDEEKQVMASIAETPVEVDGNVLTNFSFKDSASDAMIQVSDYVVCILRKYFMFLDRLQPEVEKDIASFNEAQMVNYKLLNKVLKVSLDFNPLFFNITASKYTRDKFLKYIAEYGVD